MIVPNIDQPLRSPLDNDKGKTYIKRASSHISEHTRNNPPLLEFRVVRLLGRPCTGAIEDEQKGVYANEDVLLCESN